MAQRISNYDALSRQKTFTIQGERRHTESCVDAIGIFLDLDFPETLKILIQQRQKLCVEL
jgi:hypothetical protein